ncbi:hypothetical protein PCANB_002846 [Pneumocystis canis]|nr:hypothetical protein PCANB_002846 [Pneumocystis canis]
MESNSIKNCLWKIIFAGDKVGNMGIWDIDGSKINKIKSEDEDEILESPLIHYYKLHSETISTFKFNHFSTNILYSSFYDNTIRVLHLDKELSDVRIFNNSKPLSTLGIYTSRLSISSAYWNSEGTIIATGYDDTITIFNNLEDGLQSYLQNGMKIHPLESKDIDLSSLSDSEKITFVPSVYQFHPTKDRLVGGSSSEKIIFITMILKR